MVQQYRRMICSLLCTRLLFSRRNKAINVIIAQLQKVTYSGSHMLLPPSRGKRIPTQPLRRPVPDLSISKGTELVQGSAIKFLAKGN